MNKSTLTISKLKFVGIDNFNRAVFKNINSNEYFCFVDQLYKEGEEHIAINDLKKQNYQLYSKISGFESEPDYPINYEI